MSDTATRRVIHPEIKLVSKEMGLVDYIASDESIDAHREIVSAKGWRFNRFSKNAPFVDSHNYWSVASLLGRVESYEVKGGKLVERVKWAIDVEDCELARLGFAMTEAGYLKAVSVGFIPTRYAHSHNSDDFAAAAKELKLTADQVAQCRCIYLEQEQIELSACIIGSNPNALAKAFKDGAVTEEMLAKVGFASDREMEFLTRAAAVYDEATPVEKLLIGRELEGILAARKFSDSNKGKPKAAPSSKPGGEGDGTGLDGEALKGIEQRLKSMAEKRQGLKA